MDALEAVNVVDQLGYGADDDSDDERATRITRTRVNSGKNLNEYDYKQTYRGSQNTMLDG